jgi:hypothetical protein
MLCCLEMIHDAMLNFGQYARDMTNQIPPISGHYNCSEQSDPLVAKIMLRNRLHPDHRADFAYTRLVGRDIPATLSRL